MEMQGWINPGGGGFGWLMRNVLPKLAPEVTSGVKGLHCKFISQINKQRTKIDGIGGALCHSPHGGVNGSQRYQEFRLVPVW